MTDTPENESAESDIVAVSEGQAPILEALRLYGGRATARAIAEYADVSIESQQHDITDLWETGLIECADEERDEKNQDMTVYTLTHRGRAVAADITPSDETQTDIDALAQRVDALADAITAVTDMIEHHEEEQQMATQRTARILDELLREHPAIRFHLEERCHSESE